MQPEDRLDALLSARLAGSVRPEQAYLAPESDDAQLADLLAIVDALGPLRTVEPDPGFVKSLEARLLARAAEINDGKAPVVTDDATLFGSEFPTVTRGVDYESYRRETIPAAEVNDRPKTVSNVLEFQPTERRSGPLRMPDTGRVFRVLWPAVAAAVILIFGAGTFTVRAEPGNPFFGLRQALEDIQVSVQQTATQKVGLELQHAQDRLDYLTSVVAKKGSDDEYAAALSALREADHNLVNDLETVSAGPEHDSLAAQIDTFHDSERTALFGAYHVLNWPNRVATTQALGELGETVPRVDSAVVQSVSGGSGHVLVVSGSGFQPGAVLYINGRTVPAASGASATSLTFALTDQDRRDLRDSTAGIENPDGTAASLTAKDDDANDGSGDDHQATPGATPNGTPDDHHGGSGGGPTPTPGGPPTPTPTGGDDHGGGGSGSSGGSGNP